MIVVHGTLMAALASLSGASAVTQFRVKLGDFQHKLDAYATSAEASKVDMLKMFTSVLTYTKRSNQLAVSRILAIKRLLDVALPDASNVRSPTLDQNTSFGTVKVGGNEQELTMCVCVLTWPPVG